jgi:hypothetical protein
MGNLKEKYARGGMSNPKSIAEAVMKKKMAAGGEVESQEDSDLDDDHDDFLSGEQDDEMDLKSHETYPDPEGVEAELDDPAMKRKKMLGEIMRRMGSK